MKPGTYGARLRDYYRWKAAQEQQRMELAAKIDIRILKIKELQTHEQTWRIIERQALI